MLNSVQLRVPAKLNLALAVGPPQPPRGYHPIASWFVATTLVDYVQVERIGAGEASTHTISFGAFAPKPSPVDWAIEKDLAVRAHRLLEAHVGRELPLRMSVTKHIPVGGGLGGGSADAAAALLGIDALHDLQLGPGLLRELSASLGADVAFFIDDHVAWGRRGPDASAELSPRAAIVTGFGGVIERLSGMPVCAGWLLIPEFGCPTAAVYRAFDDALEPGAMLREDRVRELVGRAGREGRVDSGALFNDLSGPAQRVEPKLGEALQRLESLGTPVHVTGSGSTMFVVGQAGEGDALPRRVRELAPRITCVPIMFG